jgi:hypothetical protein
VAHAPVQPLRIYREKMAITNDTKAKMAGMNGVDADRLDEALRARCSCSASLNSS